MYMCGIRVIYKYASNHAAKGAVMEMLPLNLAADYNIYAHESVITFFYLKTNIFKLITNMK